MAITIATLFSNYLQLHSMGVRSSAVFRATAQSDRIETTTSVATNFSTNETDIFIYVSLYISFSIRIRFKNCSNLSTSGRTSLTPAQHVFYQKWYCESKLCAQYRVYLSIVRFERQHSVVGVCWLRCLLAHPFDPPHMYDAVNSFYSSLLWCLWAVLVAGAPVAITCHSVCGINLLASRLNWSLGEFIFKWDKIELLN